MIMRRDAVAGRRRSVRPVVLATLAASLAWVAWGTGLDRIVNAAGWSSFARFWSAAGDPALDGEFVRLTVDAAVVTLAYAVLGTALSVVIGAVGAIPLSELLFPGGWVGRTARAVLVAPRAIHEVLWALLAVQVLGFDPLVPVLAIGIPFGAVTAKVFAETIDEADRRPYHLLRAGGAGRLTALAYGVLPSIRGELSSYGFYRFECGVRSAAVLGVVGAGGLGFQLDLSFESLRYNEIWTLILGLMVLSGAIEWWSSTVRRTRRPMVRRASLTAGLALVPLSWWRVDLDPSELWSPRSRELAADLAGRLVPPRLGPGGWWELGSATVDTAAMSVLAIVLAMVTGLVLGPLAARPPIGDRAAPRRGPGRRLARHGAGLALLLFRAVPAPVWAFLVVLVLFPGPWPGAVALGIYTGGVLGRLYAEVFEDRDPRPAASLRLLGGGALPTFLYGTLPGASARLVSLSLYRWEVIARETVVVGVVGAGGLGQLVNDHLAARDFAAVTSVILALLVVTAVIDRSSSVLRSRLRAGRGGPAPQVPGRTQVPASSATTGAKSSMTSWSTVT